MPAVVVRGLLAVVVTVLSVGCDDTTAPVAPSQTTVPVLFTLESDIPPVQTDAMRAAQAQYCVRQMLGRSSLTFGFSEQTYYMDEVSPGLAQVRVPAVPVDQPHVVLVHSIYECGIDPTGTGVATDGLSANGVPLGAVTHFPFTDTPALEFRVDATGRVQP
jgi:hypothetical protein